MDLQLALSASLAINAVLFLVVIVLAFRLEKNIPPQIVEALFNLARREVQKTEAKWDDEALNQVESAYKDLIQPQS